MSNLENNTDLDQDFAQAVKAVADAVTSGNRPSSSKTTELKLYALYKQATQGDIDIPQPGMIQMAARAKWGAWNAIKGKDQNQCKQEYVELCKSLSKQEG